MGRQLDIAIGKSVEFIFLARVTYAILKEPQTESQVSEVT